MIRSGMKFFFSILLNVCRVEYVHKNRVRILGVSEVPGKAKHEEKLIGNLPLLETNWKIKVLGYIYSLPLLFQNRIPTP